MFGLLSEATDHLASVLTRQLSWEDGPVVPKCDKNPMPATADAAIDDPATNDASKRQRAEDALRQAEDLFNVGHDDAARQLVDASLRMFVLPSAQDLLRHLIAFGPGSAAASAVSSCLDAKDDHTVLGLDAAAPINDAAIKRAYKQRCLLLHPDRCHARNAEEAFKRLQDAYSRLSGNGKAAMSAAARKQQQQQQQAPRRRGKPPPGTTSGARWGHGQSAHRGSKPTRNADPRNRKAATPPPPARPPSKQRRAEGAVPAGHPAAGAKPKSMGGSVEA